MSTIEKQKEYLVRTLGKKLFDSNESYNTNRDGYKILARKYWPEFYNEDGTIIKPYEVHHIDFDHSNNVISNLVVLTHTEHMRVHYMFDPKFEEMRKHFSIIRKGNPNGRLGCKHSEETKKKLSEKRKEYYKTHEFVNYFILHENGMKGKHHSDETKAKISAAMKVKHWRLENGKRVYY